MNSEGTPMREFDTRLVPDDRTTLPIDESDEWTEEDLRDIAIAAMRRFEAQHPNDDWGTDFSNPGAST